MAEQGKPQDRPIIVTSTYSAQRSTLLPMLISGLVLIVLGMAAVMIFF